MHDLLEKIEETKQYILSETQFTPRYGIILGTGLGNLAAEIDREYELMYEDIPHFPVSTVESHSGKLIFGKLGGKKIMAMQGRFHYYEGYSLQEVTFPVRVMKALGIEALFISNAAGGLNEKMQTGDLMILCDHINLLPDHPLRGKNYDTLGPRFPDMLHSYHRPFIEKALQIAKRHNIVCHTGVYAVVQGPCLETPAEYKFLHIIGADAVGMSTVPEVIVARHMSLPVFAMSVITDMGYPLENIRETSLEDVIRVAKTSEPKMTTIIKELIAEL
ncbi:MAG: purine nucleoside phosphorylase [Chitinophagales bacterium]|nr:MAG: purine nucleoside phosphorylase [Chitinophagales bacterium]